MFVNGVGVRRCGVGLVCYVVWSGFRVLLFCCDVVSCLEVSVG